MKKSAVKFMGGCLVAAMVGLLLAIMLNKAGVNLW